MQIAAQTDSDMDNNIIKSLVACFVFVHVLAACSSPSPTAITPDSTDSSTVTMDAKSSTASSVQVTKDIKYANPLDPNLPAFLLDVYAPSELEAGPVVVFLHGLNAVKEAHERESLALAERGVLVFTIN
jgi:hypothetical protein